MTSCPPLFPAARTAAPLRPRLPPSPFPTETMNYRLALASVCALLCCALPNPASAQGAGVVKPLDILTSPGKWHFINGAEFPPGSKGEVSQTTEAGAPVGVLSYDFTEGGAYAGAEKAITMEAGSSELRFRLKADVPLKTALRLVDSSGQTHQYRISYDKAGEWQLVRVNLTKKASEVYGGAKDGVIVYPVKRLCVIVQGRGVDDPGQLKFMDFRLLP